METDTEDTDRIVLKAFQDERGALSVGETGAEVPFPMRRFYVIKDVPENAVRGAHAHKKTEQALFCLQGSLTLTMDDGTRKETRTIGPIPEGTLLRSRVWHEMSGFSPDCIVLIVADEPYDESDYLREYPAFLDFVR